MKVSTENDNNFGYEKITILVDNIPLSNILVIKIIVVSFDWDDSRLNKTEIWSSRLFILCINQNNRTISIIFQREE
jgi:hypothetical protein